VARRTDRWRSRLVTVVTLAVTTTVAVLSYTWLTLPDVRSLRERPPETTAFMQIRAEEAARQERTYRPIRRWVPYDEISPLLVRAVLVTEDAGFWSHRGLDLTEVIESVKTNWRRGGLIRGGSTITQQLAKNLYLSPSRNPYRKLRELLIARRLEVELGKRRILELYLNLVEWGDGIWGVDAAARTYFGVSSSALTAEQAALLAGALINPRVYSPASPNRRLRERQKIILGRMAPR